MSEIEIKNDNSGVIFKNKYKEKDSQPDYKGKIMVDGTLKQISLWLNRPEDKEPYFGVQIEDEYIKPVESSQEDNQNNIVEEEATDDLPF